MEAQRDGNRITATLGVSSIDGVTPMPLTVDPLTGRLRVLATGFLNNTLNPAVLAPVKRDDNRVTGMMGESNTDSTPIPLTTGVGSGLRIG